MTSQGALCLLALCALGCGRTTNNGSAASSAGGSSSSNDSASQGGSSASNDSASQGGSSTSDGSLTSGAGAMAPGGASGEPSTERPADEGCAMQLASGSEHTCVRYSDGRVVCFGANGFGQLGSGDTSDDETLRQADIENAQLIAAGGDHTCAASRAGVMCWGDNRASQLGVESLEESATPILTQPLQGSLVQLVLGDQSGCYVDLLNQGYCWGTTQSSELLGDPELRTLATPTQLHQIGLSPQEFVELGGSEARLVSEERLYQLPWDPNSAATYQSFPYAPAGILQNAIAADHDCILKRTGSVWCRGEGYEPLYVVVTDFGRDVVEIDVSDGFDCARTSDGSVLCRGQNLAGQLGNGGLEPKTTATRVEGIEGAVEVSLASRHACARLDDASVWCWGSPPGSNLLVVPERLNTPTDDDRSCGPSESTPRPWNLPFPEATGTEQLADAQRAWIQNYCRCGNTEFRDIEQCLYERTFVLTGCLEALASDFDDEARCEAELAWNASLCTGQCIGSGNFPVDCGMELAADLCGASGGVFDFCKRTVLPCDAESDLGVYQVSTCSGFAECVNGFDEANCTPDAGVFTCADRSTIELGLVADGNEDCPDGSDEWGL